MSKEKMERLIGGAGKKKKNGNTMEGIDAGNL